MTVPEQSRRSISAAVQDLAARHRLPDPAASRLELLLWLLVEDPHAPTTIRDPHRVLGDHLADALTALELVELASASRLVDLGAGAGLPGLALAIARPGADFALVESTARKCGFIERAARAIGLANVEVVCQRAESWAAGLGRFDVATARALAPLDVVTEYAAPLLRIGGALIAWRGRRDPEEEEAGARAAARLGMRPAGVVSVEPYPGASHRHLHLMLKVMDTPAGFPRRPGAALKRPLGGRRGATERASRTAAPGEACEAPSDRSPR